MTTDADLLAAGNILLMTLHLGFAYAVLNLVMTPSWAGPRLALAVVLLCVNRAISYPATDGTFLSVMALVTDTTGAVLLCGTSLAMLRLAIRENTTTVDALHDRVAQVEQAVREDRERLHEINATIAGIATATRLIHDGPELTADRKDLLQDMLDSEIARLERLVDHRTAHVHDVELDKVIQPLVLSQQTMGRNVQWTPSGLHRQRPGRRHRAGPDDPAQQRRPARPGLAGLDIARRVTRPGRDPRDRLRPRHLARDGRPDLRVGRAWPRVRGSGHRPQRRQATHRRHRRFAPRAPVPGHAASAPSS